MVAAASAVGTAIEWYDFYIYGTAAALVFPQLFFPEFNPLAGTLAAFATYAVGFFARPLGGVVFGNYGDKLGRRAILIITLLLMGIATMLIGVLPTYSSIGIWAPILLVTLRILQGFGAGAEYGGAVTMTAEHAPRGRRGFYASLPTTGVIAAILLSSAVFALFSGLPEEQFLAWGWRVPFLLSIVVVAVGLYIRLRVAETPAFAQVKETHTEARWPIVDMVRANPKEVLLAIGANYGLHGTFYLFQVFMLTYISTQLGLPQSVAVTGVLIAAAIGLFTLPAFGALSDRVGRRPVYMGGAIATILFAFPFFWLVDTKSTVLIWLALVLSISGTQYAMFAPQAAFLCELFSTRVRYSGIAFSREVSAPLAGGIAPFVATALVAWSGGDPWPLALYIVALALITLVSVYLAPERYQSDISEPEEQLKAEARAQPGQA
jgi:metabolite-proton symporter